MPNDIWSVRSAARGALARGGVITGATRVFWQAAASCASPVTVVRFARPAKGRDGNIVVRPGAPQPLELTMEVPCRKCGPCLRRRAAHWRLRAASEMSRANRTWFATFTLSPEARYRTKLMACAALSAKAGDFDLIAPDEQFRRWCIAIGKELTLGFKRLRKNSGAPVRYMVVAEGHKDGTPHFHALIHELDEARPITHKRLSSDVWTLGYTRFKLCDAKGIAYVTKYLTKSSRVRVRASERYGNDLDHSQNNSGVYPRPRREPGSFLPAQGSSDAKVPF